MEEERGGESPARRPRGVKGVGEWVSGGGTDAEVETDPNPSGVPVGSAEMCADRHGSQRCH
jgi:hypothetical protein